MHRLLISKFLHHFGPRQSRIAKNPDESNHTITKLLFKLDLGSFVIVQESYMCIFDVCTETCILKIRSLPTV